MITCSRVKIRCSLGVRIEYAMSQSCPVGALPTILDGDDDDADPGGKQSVLMETLDTAGRDDGNSKLSDDQDPALHRPQDEHHISIPDIPLNGPSVKRQRIENPQSHSTLSSTVIPSTFRVKWIVSGPDLVPFVMNQDNQIIHCGRTKMQVFSTDGIATVICLKGCHWNCPGHDKGHCGCHCHTLQWHYRTR